jgi:DNA-binding LacI/PurR family transcriptional regulator
MRLTRESLGQSAAAALAAEIARGRWPRVLPGEFQLSTELQVSRSTLRQALAQLRAEGMIKTVNGYGSVVARKDRAVTAPPSRTLGLLQPTGLDQLKPYQLLWIDHLRSHCTAAGYELIVHEVRSESASKRARLYGRLLEQHQHRCWILNLSPAGLQSRFQALGVRCVVAGTCDEGVSLPFVAMDNRALGVHAAGRLLAAGHRRLAVLAEKNQTAAWENCTRGFLEVGRQRGVEPEVLRHEPDAESVGRLLGRVLRSAHRPSAILVPNPFYYLTVVSVLGSLGLRIPADISLLTTYGDPFLGYLLPSPSHYDYRPAAYARRLFAMAEALAAGRATRTDVLLEPTYIAGKSLAAPPALSPA